MLFKLPSLLSVVCGMKSALLLLLVVAIAIAIVVVDLDLVGAPPALVFTTFLFHLYFPVISAG